MKLSLVMLGVLLITSCAPVAATSEPEDSATLPGAEASEDQVFTLDEARQLRQQFEPSFASWTGGGDLSRFVYLNMSEFWPHIVISGAGQPRGLTLDESSGVGDLGVTVGAGETTVSEYVSDSPTDAVVVVHAGRVLFEAYPRMLPTDKHVWFSVSKTFVSTAVAILEDRGQIDVDQPIDSYLSDLSGTAWQGIPVVDILDMASGINCPEVKSDPDACFWDFYEAFGWPENTGVQPDAMATLSEMSTLRPSGEVFDYTSVNTELLNRLVEVVTSERFSTFVEREIWQKAGPESDALVATTANGAAFSAGGVSSNLRDLARFGMLFTEGVRSEGAPVVSDAYMEKIQRLGRPELTPDEQLPNRHFALGDESFRHNSYQWDMVTDDGDFYKGGFGGQGLYVAPSDNLVIAWFGTPDDRGGNEMLRIARQIAESSLF